MNKGNQGAQNLVSAIREIAEGQVPKDRAVDFGKIKQDYSLVLDSFPVPIPRGEWSLTRQLLTGEDKIQPGDRVIAAWVGNEAVVLGSLARW